VNSVLLRSTILGSTVCTKIMTSGRKPKAQTHPPAVNGTGTTTLILLTRLVIFLASLVCRCSRARLA